MTQSLLALHIIAGAVALITAGIAMIAAKGKRHHINSGRVYFWSMAVIFATSIPLAVIKSNVFLFLISIFSFYMAFAGLRFAHNRKGVPARMDFIAVYLMLASGAGMLITAVVFMVQGDTRYIVLLVFGTIALVLGYTDFRTHRDRTAKGKERIARHLTSMLGGTIAVVTAFVVTNFALEPRWLLWILPTVIGTPVIAWWNKRTLGS